MNQSEKINDLAAALSKCQSEMTFAVKDSLNPFHKSKYADLASVWDAVRVPLTKNGLSVVQTMDVLADGKSVLVSTLMHTSGQWIKSMLPIIYSQNTCQAQGAGITYARRYALAALVGCVQDDDDGESAMERSAKTKKDIKKEDLSIINEVQLKELLDLQDRCDGEYLGKLFSYLKSEGIDYLEKLPMSFFKKIATGMRQNIESKVK